MGIENKRNISSEEQKELDMHFKSAEGIRNVSSDFANAYAAQITMIKDLEMLNSLGIINHYDVYIKNTWLNMYELIMEKSNKETIVKIDKLIDEYNIVLMEKKNVDKLAILKKISDLVYSLRK